MIFQMYNCIIPVKGYLRATLCDVQRKDFIFVSNDFASLLSNQMNINVAIEREKMPESERHAFDKVIGQLVEKEYGFMKEVSQDVFINPKSGFQNYMWIDAIIDFDNNSMHSLASIIPKFNQLFISCLKLRFFDITDLGFLVNQLKYLEDSTIRSVELLFGSLCAVELNKIVHELKYFPRVTKIIYSSSNGHNFVSEEFENETLQIIKTDQPLLSPSCCGQISPEYFTVNRMSYFVNDKYNSCLYGKIAIDSAGNIKNCPSMRDMFGNIENSDLLEIVNSDTFRFKTLISKREIAVCKDCEFRLICPDCRAHTQNNGLYDKPEKCSYDPYQAIWK
jgi:SPASM domain peptide maturase of grasp-with-spasm system